MAGRLRAVGWGVGWLLATASVACAQDGSWPEYPFPSPHTIDRGPGLYLSWWKLALMWGLFLGWVKTTDWVNRDCQRVRLPYAVWNATVFFPFLVAFLAALLLPNFWIGLPIMGLAAAAPLGSYIWRRNGELPPHERVLTPSHLRFLAATGLNRMGIKVRVEPLAPHERGAPVQLHARGGGAAHVDQSNAVQARQSEGYLPVKELIADAVTRRSEKIILDYARESVAVRYEIDGVWHEVDPIDRVTGDQMLFVLSKLANLNAKQRRERQVGEFLAEYQGKKYPLKIFSQGIPSGQRVILHFVHPDVGFASLEDLGMREKMAAQLKEMLARSEGVFLFSAVPGQGLSTTVLFAQKVMDRYMRDFISFQQEGAGEPLAENVEQVTYDPGSEDIEQKMVSMFRREPNVVLVHQLTSAKMVELICEQAQRNKLILCTIPAKEAVEALLRVLLLKVPAKVFAPAVFGVLNQRLIRRLCDDCKQPYAPSPQLLKKLGIPTGRVDQFYRPPNPGEEEAVCEKCGGIGYYGRIALYELLTIDDGVRKTLVEQPKLEALRKAARAAGHRGLQEEGIALVARGTTSLAELQRVLKQ